MQTPYRKATALSWIVIIPTFFSPTTEQWASSAAKLYSVENWKNLSRSRRSLVRFVIEAVRNSLGFELQISVAFTKNVWQMVFFSMLREGWEDVKLPRPSSRQKGNAQLLNVFFCSAWYSVKELQYSDHLSCDGRWKQHYPVCAWLPHRPTSSSSCCMWWQRTGSRPACIHTQVHAGRRVCIIIIHKLIITIRYVG